MVVLNARLSALCALLLAAISDAQSTSELSSAVSASSAASSAVASSTEVVTSILTSVASSASASVSASAPASVSSANSSGVSSASASVSTILSGTSIASVSSAISSVASVSSAISSAAPSASTASTGPPLESTHLTIPISKYPFTSFPVPSASPIPGVFPSTSPKSPPPPGSSLIPDFGPAWKAAHARAKKLISGWSLEQKVATTTGVGWMGGRCVGNIPAVADWPGLCLEDSPLGVRDTDFVTAFPTGLSAAATWQRALIRARGLAMGQEFKGKGANVALGPMMNMGRIAQGGRNWEGFGADPFLSGEAAYETILGMQEGGVQACAKHFINNEQEHFRTQESSNVDDRTEHEIYFHPFLRSVQAGVASVMCSYNLVNDTYACENDHTLNQLLKREAGFQGYVMSDWQAHHSTLAAVAGLDMSMPGDITFNSGTSWWGANLTAFVQNGSIAETRVDDMAERILASWYLLDQDDNYPEVSFNAFFMNDPATNAHVDVQADHYKIVREIGAAGSVLLKNTDSALPLKKPRSIALIGNDSGPSSRGPNGYGDRGGDDGILAMGWGSGTTQFPYLISPLEAIQARARKDSSGSQVSWFLNNWDLAGAQATALDQDVALVFVNADSGEDYITVDGNEGDRKNLTLWGNADNLIAAIAEVNRNTIVIAHSVGPAIIEPWIENPNVTAVIWAGLPGQEAGNSITDVLYGDVNPSGRLPYTIAKSPADYSAQLITGGSGDEILRIDYTEGLNIDYRHFDANNIDPRFEFGFGLSYTTFSYTGLRVTPIAHADHTSAALESAWAAGKASPADEGAVAALWLHRPAFEVTFTVRNTGAVAGTEIAQLYLHFPSSAGEPPSVLRGFQDIKVPAHGIAQGKITLSRYDLSVWDVDAKGWGKPAGQFTFSIGASSRDFRLKGTVPL
ncbi:beta-glucosidase [Trametes versicolor FP-101664 SS1]|uniref:beta-glucosidase n=1 Tax=Trametes versicolor (strain FP-101664) TaxID=717944 RepID=UPI00046249E3|nr:beta-glucosidase [Trametes versicolor FP-101664 SS1]EIW56948.1 beta-glucosidase [Trametes versicolor FP-101664 SS1]